MKILRLRFKNINSFYGEHPPIDFTSSPLSDTGLFIISGQTGAGKSTLLDVVTLALYNQIPRFSRAISKNEIEKLGSIINMKAAEEKATQAYAEVEYEVPKGRFRATWSISKTRTGSWNNYQMEIAVLPSGDLLEVKKLSDYPDKNAELIGLTYEQFIKSIILAQGSFAEFLKADRNTRAKLLEDITGTNIYRELGRKAYEVAKEADTNVKEVLAKMDGVQVKTAEEVSALEQEVAKLEARIGTTKQELEKWNQEWNLVTRQLELERQQTVLEQEEQSIINEKSLFESDQIRLAAHEQVADCVGLMTNLKSIQTQLALKHSEVNKTNERIRDLQSQKVRLLEEVHNWSGKEVLETTVIQEVTAFEGQVTLLQNEIASIRSEAKGYFASAKRIIDESKNASIQAINLAEIENALVSLRSLEESLQAIIKAYPSDFDANKSQLDIQEKLTTIQHLEKEQQQLATILDYGIQLKKDIEDRRARQIVRGKEQETLKEYISKLQGELEVANTQIVNETAKASLEQHRKQLKEGEPCPLCGAIEHPYSSEYVNFAVEITTRIAVLKRELDIKEGKLKVEGLRYGEEEGIISASEKQLSDLRINYKERKEALLALETKIGKASDITYDILREQLESDQHQIRTWRDSVELKHTIQQLATLCKELDVIKQLLEVKNNVLSSVYKGSSVQTEAKYYLSEWNKCNTGLEGAQEVLLASKKDIASLEKELENQQTLLDEIFKERKIQSLDIAERQLLRADEYRLLTAKQKALADREIKWKTQLNDVTTMLKQTISNRLENHLTAAEIASKKEEFSSLYSELLTQCGSLLTTLKVEKSNCERFASLQSELIDLQKKQAKWDLLKRYIGDASGNTFSTFAQSLTLKNLIGMANARLSKLTDRYILEKPLNETDFLFVLDTYNGNIARAVNTLSGGETFTISLALALALSDLASRNVRIDSLFIDEGFGTLDADTLESAVCILEKLQYDGQKTVGVISHRQEMKERIPVQIQVAKGEDGSSKINIVGY